MKRAELDMKNPPGQLVNPITDQTLGDYIKRKEAAINNGVKKMTFTEWWSSDFEESETNPYSKDSAMYWAYEGWVSGQENK